MHHTIRNSKLRNLIVEQYSSFNWFNDISAADTSISGDLIACSSEFMCFAGDTNNNNSICFLYHRRSGKQKGLKYESLQNGGIYDVKASPHNPAAFASAAGDGTVALWQCKNGIDGEAIIVTSSTVLRVNGGAKVTSIAYHPSAEGIVGSLSGSSLNLWDSNNPLKAVRDIDLGGSMTMDGCWTADGVSMACLNADKSLKLVDPRQQVVCGTVEIAHSGNKSLGRVISGKATSDGILEHSLFTTGFNTMREREVAGWDVRKLDTSTFRIRVGGSGTGVLFPLLVPDMRILFVAARGGNTINAFEVTGEAPYAYPINSTITDSPTFLGIAALPVASSCFLDGEVSRIMKLTKSCVYPLKVEVPRKSYTKFNHDLFPDSADIFGAALTSEQWLAGENAKQAMVSVLKMAAQLRGEDEIVKQEGMNESTQKVGGDSATSAATKQPDPINISTPQKYIPSEFEKKFDNIVGYIPKFKYTKSKAVSQDATIFNLRPGADPCLAVAPNKFAVNWQGGGGPIYVGSLSAVGKMAYPDRASVLNGHSRPVKCLEFSPFDDSILVSGADDCAINVWKLGTNDAAGAIPGVMSHTLCHHQGGVRSLKFHPAAENVLASRGDDKVVKLWDLHSSKCVVSLNEVNNPISMDWNYDGSRLAVANRDSGLSIFDPRAGDGTEVGSVHKTHEGSKACRVCWLGDSPIILTSGGTHAGIKEFALWDCRCLKEQISRTQFGHGAASAYPLFIEENGVVLLTARGEKKVKIFEIETLTRAMTKPNHCGENPFAVYECSDYMMSGDTTTAVALAARRSLDTSRMEVARVYRLSPTALEPVTFTLPRADDVVEYFADDIYPDARSRVAALSAKEWFGGANRKPQLQSMNTRGLTMLSERDPAEAILKCQRAKNSVERFKKEREEEEARVKREEDNFLRFQSMAKTHGIFVINKSEKYKFGDDTTDHSKINDVDDSEW